MTRLGLETEIVDRAVYARTVERFREKRILLPTFAELADPERIPPAVTDALADLDPDEPHPLNLFRVHWRNGADRKALSEVPEHVVLPAELTGVAAPIIVALGDRFPLIRAHKVLAAYGCLAPRLVTGQFDPARQRAIWPSTGNYCRGGVAISRIMDCRGVAVLPGGMSAERFSWLASWVRDPGDVIRTPGRESNVKEIYDRCAELEQDERNVIFNQFCEFGNHLVHYLCTGKALEEVFRAVESARPGLELAAFVSATGSAGTIAAGDYLKERCGARIVAAEALECPTMLMNGFGEHNIQGIGDKHIPLIHNVTNTDIVTAISDRGTDALNALFNTDAGREHLLRERGIDGRVIECLAHFGLSSICNVLAAIKTAKRLKLGAGQAIITVATDGADLYASEIKKAIDGQFRGRFGQQEAARVFEEHLFGQGAEHLMVLDLIDRDRVFNLGYFTWVEQQGVTLAEFEARRGQGFWRGLRELIPRWDERIRAFNRETGMAP
ncbi:MAG: pyridoxal-5'-phosphate-dependent protein subunit beta [Planctomycetes bacterium]|nr:pyridoxal-5'-phosphate-dependent protein subunit beta [Planctomycetota bacterium]